MTADLLNNLSLDECSRAPSSSAHSVLSTHADGEPTLGKCIYTGPIPPVVIH